MWDNLTEKKPDNLIPSESIHAVKTDLKRLNLSKDAVVWFGHSSYLLINSGKKILVDPVLTTGFPASLMMKPFKGTDIYSPEDIPEVDYLIITHDHYDHLDYGTVKAIRDKVDKVICPLGVGEHLEYWGYSAEKIVEMDWNEVYTSEPGFRITCLTARHFSGRFLRQNPSLWASFMLEGHSTVYIGGDSGYGAHFSEIGKRFPHIDLAILENVGNLVCPAEFDTGAVKNAMILSVPEGDDKPLKYPLMFSICDVLLVNKIDVAPYFNFSLEKCIERVKKLNPNIQVFPISALKGEGIEPWADWLREQAKAWNA